MLQEQSSYQEPINLKMLNSMGATLINQQKMPASGFTLQIERKDLASGIYVIKIEQGNHTASQKVLLTK